jgi:c-di-GMP-binding flagellar brake protein YcgR
VEQRRKYERFDLRLSGKIVPTDYENGQVLNVVTDDISAGGAFFHTTKPLVIGAQVKLTLTLTSETLRESTGTQALMRAVGTVVRSTEEGIAIRFNGEPKVLRVAVS